MLSTITSGNRYRFSRFDSVRRQVRRVVSEGLWQMLITVGPILVLLVAVAIITVAQSYGEGMNLHHFFSTHR